MPLPPPPLLLGRYTEKVAAHVALEEPATQLSFNPGNEAQFAAMGPGFLKLCTVEADDGGGHGGGGASASAAAATIRVTPLMAPPDCSFTCFAWLIGNTLAVAADDGHVYLFVDGVFKARVRQSDVVCG